jgi:hypothetical protein
MLGGGIAPVVLPLPLAHGALIGSKPPPWLGPGALPAAHGALVDSDNDLAVEVVRAEFD